MADFANEEGICTAIGTCPPSNQRIGLLGDQPQRIMQGRVEGMRISERMEATTFTGRRNGNTVGDSRRGRGVLRVGSTRRCRMEEPWQALLTGEED